MSTENILRDCPNVLLEIVKKYNDWKKSLATMEKILGELANACNRNRLVALPDIAHTTAQDMENQLALMHEGMMGELNKAKFMGDLIREGALRSIMKFTPTTDQALEVLSDRELGVLLHGEWDLFEFVKKHNVCTMTMDELKQGTLYMLNKLDERHFTKNLIISALRDALEGTAMQVLEWAGEQNYTYNEEGKGGTWTDRNGEVHEFRDVWHALFTMKRHGVDIEEAADGLGTDAMSAVFMLLA